MRSRFGALVVAMLCATAVSVSAQTKPPAPSGATTGTKPPPSSCTLPAYHVPLQGEIETWWHSNECTEALLANFLAGDMATINKTMPGAVINGVSQLLHLATGTTNLTTRGVNHEHTIAPYDAQFVGTSGTLGTANMFTPRLYHGPIVAVDDHTFQWCETEDVWAKTTCHTVQVNAPYYIDYKVDVTFHDVSKFTNGLETPSVTLMFANYQPFTTEPNFWMHGVAGPGQPVTWMQVQLTPPGGSIISVADAPIDVDPAPTSSYGYAIDYKGNLKSFDWPRFAEPSYCGVQTATNTIWQVMFDQTAPLNQTVALTHFMFKEKTDANGHWQGPPAWDGQVRIRNPQNEQTYTQRLRIAVRPRVSSGSLEAECDAEVAAYQAWLAAGGQ
jgi:hypothetical protein